MQFWEKYHPVFEASNDAGSAPANPPASEALAPETPAPEIPVAPETPVEAPVAAAAPKTNETPWYLRELAKERGKRQEESEARAAAVRRAEEAEALAQRLQAQRSTDPNAAPSHSATRSNAPAVDQELIRQEAARQRLYEDTLELKNRGMAEFGADFNQTLNIINALGAASDEFVSDVLAVDKANAHALYKKLGEEPEKLTALAQMSSRQRIAELTRLSMTKGEAKSAESAVAPLKQVSKAPPPPPAVTPSASKVTDWRSDKSSDEDFSRGWLETQRKRAELRRGANLR